MDLATGLAAIAAAHLAAAISPGPTFLVIAREALSASRRSAAWMSAGVGLGSVVWAAAALFGLKLLFAAVPVLYLAVKIAGAAYLGYLAVMLWRRARDPLPVAAGGMPPPEGSAAAAIRRGLLTQLANPKTAVFFGSVFVALLPPDPPPAAVAILLAMVFVIEAGWYLCLTCALSVPRLRRGYARAKAAVDRVVGLFLGGLALSLVAGR